MNKRGNTIKNTVVSSIKTEKHPTLVHTYNNIGVMHQTMQEYSAALEFYRKTLQIQQKTLPQNHPDLAAIYNIGCARRNGPLSILTITFFLFDL
jgi:hypothetical protein